MIVRRLTSADASALFQLRYCSYAAAPEFQLLDAESLRWSRSDEEGVVLGICDRHGALISTMKGNLLRDGLHAVETMECSFDLDFTAFPALLLGKGATLPGKGTGGLHSLLRYLFLDAARQLNLKSVWGIVFDGAPRTRSMRCLGYQMQPPSRYWFTDLFPKSSVLIANLRDDYYELACSQLRSAVQLAEFHVAVDTASELVRLSRAILAWRSGKNPPHEFPL